MASWRTTTGGLATAIGLLLVGIGAEFDVDPNTTANWTLIAGALVAAAGAAFQGLTARDDKVTSKEAGAEK